MATFSPQVQVQEPTVSCFVQSTAVDLPICKEASDRRLKSLRSQFQAAFTRCLTMLSRMTGSKPSSEHSVFQAIAVLAKGVLLIFTSVHLIFIYVFSQFPYVMPCTVTAVKRGCYL